MTSFSDDTAMKIAFASERDGNWEIYVMNAVGLSDHVSLKDLEKM